MEGNREVGIQVGGERADQDGVGDMTRICNQFLVRDSHRDSSFLATVKCSCCREESNFNERYPFPVAGMVRWLANFVRIHRDKGCNEIQLEDPFWAAGSFTMGIGVDVADAEPGPKAAGPKEGRVEQWACPTCGSERCDHIRCWTYYCRTCGEWFELQQNKNEI